MSDRVICIGITLIHHWQRVMLHTAVDLTFLQFLSRSVDLDTIVKHGGYETFIGVPEYLTK